MEAREDQHGRFQWPPQRVDAQAGAVAAQRAVEIAQGESRRPATRGERAQRPLTWWGTVERTFFGVTSGTWAQRADEVGWEPDAVDAYCARCGQTVGMFEERGSPQRGVDGGDGACSHCASLTIPWSRVVRMGAYTGVLRECVLEVKFSAWRRLGMDLGHDHGLVVLGALEVAGIDPASAVLVPVPTSPWRRMTRGIDHTLTIARAMSASSGISLAPMLRREHRPPQTGRTLDQRRRNVAKTMSVGGGGAVDAGLLAGKTVLLVDDVMTSGATMREACRAVAEWSRAGGSGSPRLWVCPLAVTNAVEEDGKAGYLRA